MAEVTELLTRLRDGDGDAVEHLVPLLYDELRRVARNHLRRERASHTISSTALVHEAFLRLLHNEKIHAENRAEFFAAASTTMQRVLIDYARARKRDKRGGGRQPASLEDVESWLSEPESDELLALNDAMRRLERLDRRAHRVVQYRFFGGLSMDETARLLNLSAKTVQRDWASARAWLRKEVRGELSI
ncbi:hypothetical protein ABI59_09720 [Acidobacteria bacterium Mor1]|nr:hypothetical protein ABI59_09720 [Acidobacteria bacterium Mor1]